MKKFQGFTKKEATKIYTDVCVATFKEIRPYFIKEMKIALAQVIRDVRAIDRDREKLRLGGKKSKTIN